MRTCSFFLVVTHSSLRKNVHISHSSGSNHFLRCSLKSLGFALQIASLDLGLHGADAGSEEVNTLADALAIGEMGRQDGQSTDTDEITRLADDLDLLLGEVGDLVTVLLGVSFCSIHRFLLLTCCFWVSP